MTIHDSTRRCSSDWMRLFYKYTATRASTPTPFTQPSVPAQLNWLIMETTPTPSPASRDSRARKEQLRAKIKARGQQRLNQITNMKEPSDESMSFLSMSPLVFMIFLWAYTFLLAQSLSQHLFTQNQSRLSNAHSLKTLRHPQTHLRSLVRLLKANQRLTQRKLI